MANYSGREYEFLSPEEQISLLEQQQHALEREHYANVLNLRSARALEGLDRSAKEQGSVALRNIELIERKLELIRQERARLADGSGPAPGEG